jgi:hypothetical protein
VVICHELSTNKENEKWLMVSKYGAKRAKRESCSWPQGREKVGPPCYKSVATLCHCFSVVKIGFAAVIMNY